MASSSTAALRRTLKDLYREGKMAEISNPADPANPIKIWVKKRSLVELEDCVTRGNAARAAAKARYLDRNGEDYLAMTVDIRDFEQSMLAAMVIADVEHVEERKIHEKLATEDGSEWAEANLIENLLMAWQDGLADEYARDPEHPEAKATKDQLARFTEEVEAQLKEWRDAYSENLMALPKPELVARAVSTQVELVSGQAFLRVHDRWKLFYSCYDPESPNMASRIFESVSDLDDLSAQVLADLTAAVGELEVPLSEGKDSPAPDSSSDSSEPPSTVED